MKLIIKITLILFLLSGVIYAEDDYTEKPFMEEGYYRVVESVLQVPSFRYKEVVNKIYYLTRYGNDYGYSYRLLNHTQNYSYNIFLSSEVKSFVFQNNDTRFESKKGNNFIFFNKQTYPGEVTYKVILTYLGKDLKQAVKKLK